MIQWGVAAWGNEFTFKEVLSQSRADLGGVGIYYECVDRLRGGTATIMGWAGRGRGLISCTVEHC